MVASALCDSVEQVDDLALHGHHRLDDLVVLVELDLWAEKAEATVLGSFFGVFEGFQGIRSFEMYSGRLETQNP